MPFILRVSSWFSRVASYFLRVGAKLLKAMTGANFSLKTPFFAIFIFSQFLCNPFLDKRTLPRKSRIWRENFADFGQNYENVLFRHSLIISTIKVPQKKIWRRKINVLKIGVVPPWSQRVPKIAWSFEG